MELAEKQFLKKYAVHFVRTMLMLGAVFVFGVLLLPEDGGTVWRTVLLAAVAAISLHFLWGTWRLIRSAAGSSDEMVEAIWMRGGSYAHSASILLAAVYGLLESVAGLPRVSMTVASVVMIVISFIAAAVVQRRYA